MFKLFQIRPSREQCDRVNELGWTQAFEEMPIIEAWQAVGRGGSEAYVTEYDQYFEHVADIAVDSLEAAFDAHNMEDESKITRYRPQHSMSVGDVLVDEFGGVHMCDNIGFTQIMSSFIGSNQKVA